MKREKRILRKISWRWATALALSLSLLTGTVLSEAAKAQINDREAHASNSVLTKYVIDLTAAAE